MKKAHLGKEERCGKNPMHKGDIFFLSSVFYSRSSDYFYYRRQKKGRRCHLCALDSSHIFPLSLETSHNLVHRFGIEAVTLEGFEKKEKGSPAVFYQLGRYSETDPLKSLKPFFYVHVSVLGEGEGRDGVRTLVATAQNTDTYLIGVVLCYVDSVMEGLFRSLNNLLERFHQSYFFYLQPTTDRYISIGMYMPPLGLLCAALLIKAFGLWLRMQKDPADSASAPTNQKSDEDIHEVDKAEQSEEGEGAYSVEQQVQYVSHVKTTN
uniref:Uncharacterized protein n=1 Tax=Timema cristinae TaxID=61476 RepID=A0A7R9CNZ5_TIMCR|nr:unnamed protein product [Timema cristinae]